MIGSQDYYYYSTIRHYNTRLDKIKDSISNTEEENARLWVSLQNFVSTHGKDRSKYSPATLAEYKRLGRAYKLNYDKMQRRKKSAHDLETLLTDAQTKYEDQQLQITHNYYNKFIQKFIDKNKVDEILKDAADTRVLNEETQGIQAAMDTYSTSMTRDNEIDVYDEFEEMFGESLNETKSIKLSELPTVIRLPELKPSRVPGDDVSFSTSTSGLLS